MAVDKTEDKQEVDAAAKDAAKVKEETQEAKAKDSKAKKAEWVLGERKAITTKKGIKSDGDEITVDDLGKEAFEAFKKSGHIVKG